MPNAVPLYQRLYHELKASIEGGAYAEGDQFPTEQQLERDFAVSRVTVRRAVEMLRDEGLLTRMQGSGTFVHLPKDACRFRPDDTLYTFFDDCQRQRVRAGVTLLERDVMRPSAQDRAFFGMRPNDLVLYLRRVATADDLPVMEERISVPYDGFEALLSTPFDNRSLYDVLRQTAGRVVSQVHHRTVEAVAATRAQALLLKVDEGSPLLKTSTYYLDTHDRSLCVVRCFCVAERYVLTW